MLPTKNKTTLIIINIYLKIFYSILLCFIFNSIIVQLTIAQNSEFRSHTLYVEFKGTNLGLSANYEYISQKRIGYRLAFGYPFFYGKIIENNYKNCNHVNLIKREQKLSEQPEEEKLPNCSPIINNSFIQIFPFNNFFDSLISLETSLGSSLYILDHRIFGYISSSIGINYKLYNGLAMRINYVPLYNFKNFGHSFGFSIGVVL